jgi:chorismate mutase
MSVRGVRGAITCSADQPEAILQATQDLLIAIQAANPGMHPEDFASIFFTATPDLSSTHPAKAARQLGWNQVPLLCAQEIDVPDSLPRCIRVLLHWNTTVPQHKIQHVYIGEAAVLRPDIGEPVHIS